MVTVNPLLSWLEHQPSNEVREETHVPKKIRIHDSWMHRIDCHISTTQAFGKFSGKQYVRQLALVVGFALIVGLFAVQICCVDFPSCMSQTGEIDYPTGRRFLGKNGHWHDVIEGCGVPSVYLAVSWLEENDPDGWLQVAFRNRPRSEIVDNA